MATHSPKPQHRLKAANDLVQQRKLKQAIVECNRAIHQYPEDGGSTTSGVLSTACGANTSCDRGEYQQAVEDYNEAICLDGESAGAYYRRAKALNGLGKDT